MMDAAKFRYRFPIGTACKLLLSVACLSAIYRWIDPADLARKSKAIAIPPFLMAIALNLLMQVLNAAKIRLLFPPPRPPLHGLVASNFIAVFFSTFIPGGIGGEVARWGYMTRESGSGSRALAAILLDRITGLWAQILLALSAWLWLSRNGVALWVAAPAALLIVAATLWACLWGYRGVALAMQRFGAWYVRRKNGAGGKGGKGEKGGADAAPEDIAQALAGLLADRGRFARVAGLSVVNLFIVLAIFLLIDRSIGGDLDWAQAALVLICYTAILMLPVTLGNWGLSEGTLGILYHYAGSQSGTGVLISLLLRAMNLPAAAVGWYYFLMRRKPR
jgi:uncharacterized membrane protein YbhN (UPF0104 family)